MKRQILMGDNPLLRKTSALVQPEELSSDQLQNTIDGLFDSMEQADGLGLAAPQVDIQKRFVIVVLDNQARCLVNPQITQTSKERVLGEEGCLSFPGLFGQVARYKSVTVSALDRHGKSLSLALSDLNARVVQHELDHLDGILLPDRLAEKVEPGLELQVAGRPL